MFLYFASAGYGECVWFANCSTQENGRKIPQAPISKGQEPSLFYSCSKNSPYWSFSELFTTFAEKGMKKINGTDQ